MKPSGKVTHSDHMKKKLCEFIVIFVTPLCKMRPAGRKTRVVTLTNDNHVSVSWFSDVNGVSQRKRCAWMWRRLRNAHVLLHVPAKGDSPVSLAMTHMRWAHGQSGRESTDYTLSVVPLVGGWEAWPIDRCSNKDVGRRERETPTPCVRTKQAPIKNTTKTTREIISQTGSYRNPTRAGSA